MEGVVQAGLDVAQKGVDPGELRQVVGILTTGANSLVVAVGCDHGTAENQSIGEHLTARHKRRLGQSTIASELKATHNRDPGVNQMTGLIQRGSRDDWNLVLRSATGLTAR